MQKCIKCGKPDNDDDSTYCPNCGYELNSNYCTNEFCDRNNGTAIPLLEEDCYCDICGSESKYFVDGLIKPRTFN